MISSWVTKKKLENLENFPKIFQIFQTGIFQNSENKFEWRACRVCDVRVMCDVWCVCSVMCMMCVSCDVCMWQWMWCVSIWCVWCVCGDVCDMISMCVLCVCVVARIVCDGCCVFWVVCESCVTFRGI